MNQELIDNIFPAPGSTYKSTNKYSKPLSLVGLLVGMIIATGIGYLYGIISFYNPIIYLNFLALAGALLCVALTGVLSRFISKSRNATVDMISVICFAFFAWYVSWVYFYADQKVLGFFDALLRFGDVLQFAFDYASNHTLSVGRLGSGGLPMPSAVMFLFYVVEFGAFFFAVIIARKINESSYYCENCNKRNTRITRYGERTNEFEKQQTVLQKGDATFFEGAELAKDIEKLNMVPASGKIAGVYKLEYSYCKKCGHNNLIDVTNGILKIDDKGEMEFTGETPLIIATFIDEKSVSAMKRKFKI
jgi:hypothetical protein